MSNTLPLHLHAMLSELILDESQLGVQRKKDVFLLCVYVEWSREMLLESWIADAVACCEKCGVVPPSAVVPDYSLQPRDTDAGSAFSLPLPMPQFPVIWFYHSRTCLF